MKNLKDLSLDDKIKITNYAIREWYEINLGRVFIAWSGSLRSTAMMHLVRHQYPNIPVVHVRSSINYPEIADFARKISNITILDSKYQYETILAKKGYSIIDKEISLAVAAVRNKNSKIARNVLQGYLSNGEKNKNRTKDWSFLLDAPFNISAYCCLGLKFGALKHYITDTRTSPYKGNTKHVVITNLEDKQISQSLISLSKSTLYYACYPIRLWKKADILKYLYKNKLLYPKQFGNIIYNNSAYKTEKKERKGCLLCLMHMDKQDVENKFLEIKEEYPQFYDQAFKFYNYAPVCDFLGYKY